MISTTNLAKEPKISSMARRRDESVRRGGEDGLGPGNEAVDDSKMESRWLPANKEIDFDVLKSNLKLFLGEDASVLPGDNVIDAKHLPKPG